MLSEPQIAGPLVLQAFGTSKRHSLEIESSPESINVRSFTSLSHFYRASESGDIHADQLEYRQQYSTGYGIPLAGCPSLDPVFSKVAARARAVQVAALEVPESRFDSRVLHDQYLDIDTNCCMQRCV